MLRTLAATSVTLALAISVPRAAGPISIADAAMRGDRADVLALIKQGAEVIIPMGISQCPVHIKPDWLQNQLGVPVVEAIGAPIRMAGLLAGLGLKQSRVRWPKSPH